MAEQIISKRCCTCNEIKPLSEFYKNRAVKDGYQRSCKLCFKKHQRVYSQSEKGRRAHRQASFRYNRSKKGQLANKQRSKQFKVENPQIIKARKAISYAVKSNKLPRPDSLQCHYCQAQAKQYHHHKGYVSKHRKDVIPVCDYCHHNLILYH